MDLNSERVHPEDMPSDLKAFKAWVDFACVEWDSKGEMCAQAANAWSAVKVGEDPEAIEKFHLTYLAWYTLPEEEKERRYGGSLSTEVTKRMRDAAWRAAHIDVPVVSISDAAPNAETIAEPVEVESETVCTIDLTRCPMLRSMLEIKEHA